MRNDGRCGFEIFLESVDTPNEESNDISEEASLGSLHDESLPNRACLFCSLICYVGYAGLPYFTNPDSSSIS